MVVIRVQQEVIPLVAHNVTATTILLGISIMQMTAELTIIAIVNT